MNKLLLAGMLALGALGVGCDRVTNAVDCHAICDRYRSCYDSGYNTDACEDRCRDKANADKDYMQRSQECTACLDNNKDCLSTTFLCAGDCGGIVP